jgi:hypothetical protein
MCQIPFGAQLFRMNFNDNASACAVSTGLQQNGMWITRPSSTTYILRAIKGVSIFRSFRVRRRKTERVLRRLF